MKELNSGNKPTEPVNHLIRLGHRRKTTDTFVGFPLLVGPPTADTPLAISDEKGHQRPSAGTSVLAA